MDNLNGRRPQPEGRSFRAAGNRQGYDNRPVVASRLAGSQSRPSQPKPEAGSEGSPSQASAKPKPATASKPSQANKPNSSPLGRINTWAANNRNKAIIVAVLLMAIAGAIVWAINSTFNTEEGTASEVTRQYQEQLPELKSKVKDSPDDASARKSYAVALYATDDLDEARKQYEEAIKLDKKDATAYNNLGNVHRDLGDHDKAIESYRKSIDLNPKAINPYANMANIQLYTKDQPDEAIKTYQAGLKEMPDNTQLELLLGIAYEQKGDIAKAKSTYQNILSRDADNAAAKANLERLNSEED